mmetsp:Transcript_23182/g.48142  ORF Transcript_23182/g.48142 Transcript_23182/m.48142 type:complete len:85 (-) Transcript_23182:545-799(-)
MVSGECVRFLNSFRRLPNIEMMFVGVSGDKHQSPNYDFQNSPQMISPNDFMDQSVKHEIVGNLEFLACSSPLPSCSSPCFSSSP